MRYEKTPRLSTTELLAMVRSKDDLSFARALHTAAKHLQPRDFELVLLAAHDCRGSSDIRGRAIAEAISTILQERRILPGGAEQVLLAIPDGPKAAASRDKALSLLRTRERGDPASRSPGSSLKPLRGQRRAALNQLTEEASELGLYDGSPSDYAAALKSARRRRARPRG